MLIYVHLFCRCPSVSLQPLVQGRLVRAGLQGSPRQAARPSGVPQDLLRHPETADGRAQHQPEQHVRCPVVRMHGISSDLTTRR